MNEKILAIIGGVMCIALLVCIAIAGSNREKIIKSQDELIQAQDTLIVDYEDIIIMQGVLIKNKCQ